jgi:hypothetical protein
LGRLDLVDRSPIAGSGIGDDLPAWQVHDTSTVSGSVGTYLKTPTATDLAAAEQLGWVVRVTLRVPDANDAIDASIYVELATDDRRFGLAFGSDASGTRVRGSSAPQVRSTVPAGTFHIYELRYRAASATAGLYVDGALVEAGSVGIDAGAVAPRFIFGSAQSSSIGRGQYHRVEWIIRDDVDLDGSAIPTTTASHREQRPAGRRRCRRRQRARREGATSVSVRARRRQPGRLGRPRPAARGRLADLAPPLWRRRFRCSASDDPSACGVGTAVRIARARTPASTDRGSVWRRDGFVRSAATAFAPASPDRAGRRRRAVRTIAASV